ncbi:hypothetical protein ACET3Z_013117 [Daucus carota]
MTQHSLLINDLLRDFMNTARVSDVDQVLGVSCVIQGRDITITETLLNEVLGLPTANFVPVPTEEERIAFFNQINCSLDDQGRLPKKIYVTHLPKEWNFFFSCVSYVFAPKVGGFHGLTTFNQNFGIAIAENRPINFGHLIMEEFQRTLTGPRSSMLYPRFFQLVLNHALSTTEKAAYARCVTSNNSYLSLKQLMILHNKANYPNNHPVVLTQVLRHFLENMNVQVQVPHGQAAPEIQDDVNTEEAAEVDPAAEPMTEATEGHAPMDVDADPVVPPRESDVVSERAVNYDDLFTDNYTPEQPTGSSEFNPDNLSFHPDELWMNMLDTDDPLLLNANAFAIPQTHNQGIPSHTYEAETSHPSSHTATNSEREGEDLLSAPLKSVVSDTTTLSLSTSGDLEHEATVTPQISSPLPTHITTSHSKVHTLDELTVANTLSTMSRSDTAVFDSFEDPVPSQANEGNLDVLPTSTSLSTLLGGTFPDPPRDPSPLEGERQSAIVPFISRSEPIVEDLTTSHSLSTAVVGNQGASPTQGSHPSSPVSTHLGIPIQDPSKDSLPSGSRQLASNDSDSSDEETEDEALRILIAPPLTSLKGAREISSAGTSLLLGAGDSVSVSDTPTEHVKQHTTAQPSDPNLSESRETPTERISEDPSKAISSPPPTVSLARFEALEFEVRHLKAENLVLREELLEVKTFSSQLEQRLATLEARSIASQISQEDNSTEGERVVEKAVKGKAKAVLEGLTEEVFESALDGVPLNNEPYIPEHVETEFIPGNVMNEEDLEEGEIPQVDEVFVDELAYHDDMFPEEEIPITNPQDIPVVRQQRLERNRLRERLENQRRIRREKLEATRLKQGVEWDIARSVFEFPEVVKGNHDKEVQEIFDVFKSNYENLHEFHEALDKAITSVSIMVIPAHGWSVHITFILNGESRRFKHVTCELLRNLSLTELFVVKNKIIATGEKYNEVFRDKVVEWLTNISVEIHDNPPVIKYFKDKMIQSIGLKDEALSGYHPRILSYLEGEIRRKCSNTKKGRLTAELLYAYRLNFAALKNKSLESVEREQPYPLPPLDPETPDVVKPASVSYNPTSITFRKFKKSEPEKLTLEEIGECTSKCISRAIRQVKYSVIKEDKAVLIPLLEILRVKKCTETAQDTERVRAHPSRLMMKVEGMNLNIPFKRLKKMRHLTSLEKMQRRFETTPPVNALEVGAYNIITSRIKEIETKIDQLKAEKAAKKKAEEALLNATAKKARRD